jgi:glycosyltransferase involved in cell wall biosynthesis
MVKLGVIIPCYNVAPYVRAAVTSVLDQTMRDLEVIVVNDGSTDNTGEVLRKIQEERCDRRLHVIDRPNGGPSVARNTGIAVCSAPYIGFLDGDDLWLPQKAERHLTEMDADPTIGMTYSASSYIGQAQGVWIPRKAEPSLHDMIRHNHAGGSLPILRRECFSMAGLFNENLRYCEDWEMWCRILHYSGLRAVLIPEVLTLYRLRQSSATHQYTNFLHNADAAVASMSAKMPGVPSQVFREGRAIHYRFIAWRAASDGHRWQAARFFGTALYHCPSLLWHNWRDVATMTAALFLSRTFITRIQGIRARKFRNPSDTVSLDANL